MALEDLTGTKYIDSLNSSNPVGASDPKSEGDDHIRGIKNVLKTTFPNVTGAITSNQTEINLLDGATSIVQVDSTDTLSNKTLTAPTITGSTSISGTIATDVVMEDGQGIDFSAYTDGSVAGTTTSQILLDYEEGTWTPTLQDTSHSDAEGQTYTVNVGYYTKIGRIIFFHGAIQVSSIGTLTGGDLASIAGLPYTCNASTYTKGPVSVSFAGAMSITALANVTGLVINNQTYLNLYNWDATTGTSNHTVTNFGTGNLVYFSGSYII